MHRNKCKFEPEHGYMFNNIWFAHMNFLLTCFNINIIVLTVGFKVSYVPYICVSNSLTKFHYGVNQWLWSLFQNRVIFILPSLTSSFHNSFPPSFILICVLVVNFESTQLLRTEHLGTSGMLEVMRHQNNKVIFPLPSLQVICVYMYMCLYVMTSKCRYIIKVKESYGLLCTKKLIFKCI